MKKILPVIALLLLGLTLALGAAAEDETCYLRLSTHEGNVTESAHMKWIEVISFSIESEEDAETTFTFRHPIDDRAAESLKERGGYYPYITDGKMEICRRFAGRNIMCHTVEFSNIRVTSVKTVKETAEDGSTYDVQEVTMRPEKITWNNSGDPVDNVFSYLSLQDVTGNSSISTYLGWIEVLSFTSLPGDPQSNITEEMFSRVVFTHPVDRATPVLQAAAAEGDVLYKGEFAFTMYLKGTRTEVNRNTLEGVQVKKARVFMEKSPDGKGMRAVEEVTLLCLRDDWWANPETVSDPGCYFLQMEGVPGNSAASGYEGWNDVYSFAAETENLSAAYFSVRKTLTFRHPVDSAAMQLTEYKNSGTVIPKGEVRAVETNAGRQTVTARGQMARIKVTGTKITLEGSHPSLSRPVQEVTLQYEEEEWTIPAGHARPAGDNIYLKIIGVDGEVTETAHDKWAAVSEYDVTGTDTLKIIRPADAGTEDLRHLARSGATTDEGTLHHYDKKTMAGKPYKLCQVDISGILVWYDLLTAAETKDRAPMLTEETLLRCEKLTVSGPPLSPLPPVPTGDSAPAELYIAALLISVSGAGFIWLRRLRKRA